MTVEVLVPLSLAGVTRLQVAGDSGTTPPGDFPYYVGAGGGEKSVAEALLDVGVVGPDSTLEIDALPEVIDVLAAARLQRLLESAPCRPVSYEVPALHRGTTEIEIAYLPAGKAAFVPTGTIRLEAQPKYAGAVTFGFARTDAPDRTFSLVPDVFQTAEGTDSTRAVVAVDGPEERWRPVLGISPFGIGLFPETDDGARRSPVRLGPRAIRSWQGAALSINPYLGVDIEAPLDNLYLGATVGVFDWLYATGGWHLARTSRLPSGLDVGDAFTGAAVPTVRETNTVWFWGFGADAGPVISALGNVFKNVIK